MQGKGINFFCHFFIFFGPPLLCFHCHFVRDGVKNWGPKINKKFMIRPTYLFNFKTLSSNVMDMGLQVSLLVSRYQLETKIHIDNSVKKSVFACIIYFQKFLKSKYFSLVDLTFIVLPNDTELWSRINENTDLASHHNPNDILQNIELTESLLNEMCAIKQIAEDEIDDKKKNLPMNLNEHPYGKGIRAMSSMSSIRNLAICQKILDFPKRIIN
jgi:hypothetical protein